MTSLQKVKVCRGCKVCGGGAEKGQISSSFSQFPFALTLSTVSMNQLPALSTFHGQITPNATFIEEVVWLNRSINKY